MGAADFTPLDDGLDLASLDRGVSTGIPRPNGGGGFAFAFNSLTTAKGAAGYFSNAVGFAPTPAYKGGSIRAAIARGISGGPIGFTPMLYIQAQGPSVNDQAYLLGLQDDDPHRIALRKGRILDGIPAASPGTNGILRRSTGAFAPGTYHHLRLDAIVNTNGDVILKVFRNDLGAHPVGAPDWQPIPGLEDASLVASHGAGIAFIDDAVAINSGSQSFTSGRMGWAFQTADVARRMFVDYVECNLQQ